MSICEIDYRGDILAMSRAAAFWASCSFFIVFNGNPQYKLLQ